MENDKRKRPYRSAVRQAAAAKTRQRILTAAGELFVANGFANTATKAVAARAGVTERTIFLNFPSKAALLSACIRAAVRGEAEDVPLLERAEWRLALTGDPDHVFGLLAQAVAQLYERAADLLAVGEAAAADDPLLDAERRRGHAATRADLLKVAKAMKRTGALRRGVSPERAADVMLAVAANESLYLRLVRERDWSVVAYTRMLERALAGALGR
jgi:AcrR family transcriptional regulator